MQFPFISSNGYLSILRVALAMIMMAHGIIRIYAGTVSGFGDFLAGNGLPLGKIIAWGITIFEIVAGITLILNQYRKWICALFIAELIAGIYLVHLKNGWFVVGYTSGGMEYSTLLILCFLVTASNNK